MDRATLQKLAESRLKDAKALLEKRRWSGAFYFCGYVIECALKACILRYLGESGSVFGDRDYLKRLADCWTHDLVRLVNLAGLDAELGAACSANLAFNNFWAVAKDWKETSRYVEKTASEAKALYEAVSNNSDAVFRWIQSHW